MKFKYHLEIDGLRAIGVLSVVFYHTIIKNECVTHNVNFTYYSDSHHPSFQASKMINKLLINLIDKNYTNK